MTSSTCSDDIRRPDNQRDRGPQRPRAQYTSWVFGHRLREAGLLGSMGRIGCGLDNAVAESFFGSMQIELLDRQTWITRDQLGSAMFESPWDVPIGVKCGARGC